MKQKKAVFLDRDGVLNRALVYPDGKPHPPSNLEEFEILPGVHEACRLLNQAGFLLVVVTNQPDVARGTQHRGVVEAMNSKLLEHLPLHDIRVCYHDDHDSCNCRKPEPGLLLDASLSWDIALESSFMVGDRWKDIAAGKRAGCNTILVTGEHLEKEKETPDFRASSLLEATSWILQNRF